MSDTPNTPQVLGELLPEERHTLQSLRHQSEQALLQLGRLAVQESRLTRSIETMEAQAQGILQAAGKRHGIPDGTPWSTTPDGKIVLAGPMPESDEVPTPAEDEASA